MRRLRLLFLLFPVLCAAQDTLKPVTKEVIVVSKSEYPLADAKVRLIGLLLKSLHNQHDGILDLRLEKQIVDQEKKIQNWPKDDNTQNWAGTGFTK